MIKWFLFVKKENNCNRLSTISEVTLIIMDLEHCNWAKTSLVFILLEEGQFQHRFFFFFFFPSNTLQTGPHAVPRRRPEQSGLVTSPQRKTSSEHIYNNSFGILVCETTSQSSSISNNPEMVDIYITTLAPTIPIPYSEPLLKLEQETGGLNGFHFYIQLTGRHCVPIHL